MIRRYESNWEDEPPEKSLAQIDEWARRASRIHDAPQGKPSPFPKGEPVTQSSLSRAIGAALLAERKRRIWSQRTMASQLGIAYGTYRSLEMGKGGTVQMVDKCCDVLGWSVTVTPE